MKNKKIEKLVYKLKERTKRIQEANKRETKAPAIGKVEYPKQEKTA
jgi:hypothetical protein